MHRAIVWTGMMLWLAACANEGDAMPSTLGNVSASGAGAIPRIDAMAPANSAGTPATMPAQPPIDAPATDPNTQATPVVPATPMAQATPMTQPSPMTQPAPLAPMAMDECGLHTGWRGDEYCILPPPPDKGFQLHIGPSNYDHPEAVYLLQPGQETTHTFTTTSANDHNIDFYFRQYRMRPGAHHTIVRDTSTGRRLSGSDVNQDHPVGGIIAPENAGIGIPLTAHSPISVDHHAINTTDKALLQEVWVNFWYVDPAKVTETTTLLYDPGSIQVNVAPHADVVLGPYECDIKEPGRLISMFGHVHANNVRFSAWRTRNGHRDLIYESHRWEEPLWLEFTSLAQNPVVDSDKQIDGGWSGILDLQPGDTIGWECHEVNQQDTALHFTNQTFTGTMCIIIGDTVGTKCVSRNPSAVINPNLE